MMMMISKRFLVTLVVLALLTVGTNASQSLVHMGIEVVGGLFFYCGAAICNGISTGISRVYSSCIKSHVADVTRAESLETQPKKIPNTYGYKKDYKVDDKVSVFSGTGKFEVRSRARVTRNTRQGGRTLVVAGQEVSVIQVEAINVYVRDEEGREFALPKDNLEPLGKWYHDGIVIGVDKNKQVKVDYDRNRKAQKVIAFTELDNKLIKPRKAFFNVKHKQGDRVSVISNAKEKWYDATVVEVNRINEYIRVSYGHDDPKDARYIIHFGSNCFDLPNYIRPWCPYHKGDKVSVFSVRKRGWYDDGYVAEINMKTQKIRVVYDRKSPAGKFRMKKPIHFSDLGNVKLIKPRISRKKSKQAKRPNSIWIKRRLAASSHNKPEPATAVSVPRSSVPSGPSTPFKELARSLTN